MMKKCNFPLLMMFLVCACNTAKVPKPSSSQAESAESSSVIHHKKQASFDWFEYQGKDKLFDEPLVKGKFQNPIVSGFFPDPSITRKGDDYYMVHSSFSYAPGVPILHSTDLVNWQLIGHALSNSKQLDYSGLTVSRGTFAPTIRYHDGLFYMITTAVDSGGNFFVTAKDPAGEWSEPYWLPEIGGIDPDIFFDDNGKVYIAHNDAPIGEPLYQGHRAVWLWEYDMAAKKVIKDSGRVIVNGGADISQEPVWVEGPHIYKVAGWYYLMCAEGGTSVQHSEVIFRTRSLTEAFVPYSGNPILTQRDLDKERANPITSTGHADMIQTPAGDWWAVFLATRPYEGDLYNTGRETFLLPVSWKNEWPVILEKGKTIPHQVIKPKLTNTLANSDTLTGNFTWRDDFTSSELGLQWNILRSVNNDWYQLDGEYVTLTSSPIQLTDLDQPVYLARRQQHSSFQASTSLILPSSKYISAGIVALQNGRYHYYFAAKKLVKGYQLFLEQVEDGKVNTLKTRVIDAKAGQKIELAIDGNGGRISFTYQIADQNPVVLGSDLDATMLSTAKAGGFVGTTLGIHSRVEDAKN